MALTGKQVRQLRSLAHHLNPIIHIGKSDITDALVKETEAALENRELIKCAVQDGATLKPARPPICSPSAPRRCGPIIGHRFSLYRESAA